MARAQQAVALSVAQLIRRPGALARALSADDVNELGRRKSYANLHKFDTAKEHIATGLIWA
jgi:hypothetical protein